MSFLRPRPALALAVPLRRLALGFALLGALASGSAHADKVLGGWTPVFQGIDYMTGYETNVQYPGETSTRRLAVNVMRIDLSNPDISFFTTPGNGDGALDTYAQTAGQFLEENQLAVAVNANFFDPCCNTGGQAKNLIGLAVSEGQVVSPADTSRTPIGGAPDTLAITQDNQVRFTTYWPGDDISGIYNAVSAGPLLVNNGQSAVSVVPADAWSASNPRTAVGLSEDGNYLLLLTIDGRQPGVSDGATLYETASWLMAVGAYQGLNLDGGGSTSMVMADADGDAVYLNSPSAGAPRWNGNHLGVYALPVPEPSSAVLLVLGLLVLNAARRRRLH